MRIAIFSDNFYPELSGISDSIILLGKELTGLGHEVNFFAPRYSASNYKMLNLPFEELALDGKTKIQRLFSLPALLVGPQSRLVLPLFSPGLFKKFKPEIIHSQLFFGAGLEGLIRARLNKLPLIGTNHTRIKEFITGYTKSRWLKKVLTAYMKWYYNQCDYVTAPSRFFLDELLKSGFTAPSRSISNPVDMKVFNNLNEPNRDAIRKKYKLANNIVVYAGRLAREKNIDIIIRAIKIVKEDFPGINFVLAGHGHAEQSLRKLTSELSLEENIKFIGALNHRDLAELYRSSDVFAIASTSEVQSMTIIQAMACGLPAVGVNCNSIPELVKPDNGLLFAPGDYSSLAQQIIKILSNADLKKRLSQGAINLAHKYSAVNIAKEWVELYSLVIKEYEKKYEIKRSYPCL